MRSPLLPAVLLVLALGGSVPAMLWSRHGATAAGGIAQPHPASGTDEAHPRGGDFRALRLPGPFPAVVTDVIDGDTFEARVTIWLGHEVTTRVRVLGIDAAERGSECAEERALAEAARAALARLLDARVELTDVRFDKYGGRVLARIRSRQAGDVASRMLADGFAIAYDGGRREPWCENAVRRRK